jgi:hypothetical protein
LEAGAGGPLEAGAGGAFEAGAGGPFEGTTAGPFDGIARGPLEGTPGGRGMPDGRGGPCDGPGRGGTSGAADPKRVKLPDGEVGAGLVAPSTGSFSAAASFGSVVIDVGVLVAELET